MVVATVVVDGVVAVPVLELVLVVAVVSVVMVVGGVGLLSCAIQWLVVVWSSASHDSRCRPRGALLCSVGVSGRVRCVP